MIKSLNSLLSLQPLVVVLKKMITEGKPGAKKLYNSLIREVEDKQELLSPMKEYSALKNDPELVEALLSTIFPPSTSSNQGIYAVTPPFQTDTVYASPGFKKMFLKNDSGIIHFSDNKTGIDVSRVSLCLAYDTILKKFYSSNTALTGNSVHALKDGNGLKPSLSDSHDTTLNSSSIQLEEVSSMHSFKLISIGRTSFC